MLGRRPVPLVTLTPAERLAFWVRRRRPGRHRRSKAAVPSRLPSRGTSP
jgi:hypothetical protein